jgi:ubiquinone/menaquinone biosynthesis C-methylase UbiE
MKTLKLKIALRDKNISVQPRNYGNIETSERIRLYYSANKGQTHEEKVERFFSHGSILRSQQDNGYLSFGYWTKKGEKYYQAAQSLVDLLLSKETPLSRGIILNVACGNGSETFDFYKYMKPEKIVAIDITAAHIEYAQKIVQDRNLVDKIKFEKQDACILPYGSKTFAYVIGVEGPSQFNTREQFLKRAYDVLEPNGVLLLTDVIVHNDVAQKSWLNRKIGQILSKHWYMPKPNWMNFERYSQMLQDIGFRIDFFKGIGANVYPGFVRFNLKISSIINALRVRGFRNGLGLTFLSWLLGLASKRGMVDYAYIRATKFEVSS